MGVLIIDGYVDEPACFGVPPYISPYVRYAAGVFYERGIAPVYKTADDWRGSEASEQRELLRSSELVILIMGLLVPGRYRGGSPLTLKELAAIAAEKRGGKLILAGGVHHGYTLRGGRRAINQLPEGIDYVACGDPEASIALYLREGEWRASCRDYAFVDAVAVAGAEVVRLHPNYPDVIAEIEISRGCDRAARCSFCIEGQRPIYEERSIEGTATEIAALARAGVRAFRLGRSANILAYGSERGRPNPEHLASLYRAIRASAPELTVLHTDNCNPASIARFPQESREAIAAIARYNTEGDGLSLGLECMDPEVARLNCLKVSAEEALAAVRAICEAGGGRRTPNSLPSLLPGLNFLVGLAGDSAASLGHNLRFLESLLAEGLAVRRINIRRAMVFAGTRLARLLAEHPSQVRERDYRRFKEWVRERVDPVMMERVAPIGTVLRQVIAEERRGAVLFGRQLGSYPPLTGIVTERHGVGEKLDAAVTSHGARSLTAIPHPLDINGCGRAEIEALPGIGRARARRIMELRPYSSMDELASALDSEGAQVIERLAKAGYSLFG